MFQIRHLQPSSGVAAFSGQPLIPAEVQYPVSDVVAHEVLEPGVIMAKSQAAAYRDYETLHTTTPSTIVENEAFDDSVVPKQHVTAEHQNIIDPSPTAGTPGHSTSNIGRSANGAFDHSTNIAIRSKTRVSQLESSLDTQASNIPEMTKALRSMMHVELVTQGETQAQALSEDSQSVEGRLLDGERQKSRLQAGLDSGSQPAFLKPVLSRAVADRLELQRVHLKRSAARVAINVKASEGGSPLVLCECEFARAEGDMVSHAGGVGNSEQWLTS